MRFQPLEKLINLHDGYRCRFKLDDLQVLLIQHEGEHYLFESRCPHNGQLLDHAKIDANCLTCPLHQYRFDLRSGALITRENESCRALRIYTPAYEGNEIGMLLD